MKASFTHAEKTKRAEKQTLAALIHPTSWNKSSRKFVCRMLHTPAPTRAEVCSV
jgi:hypothetical protein